MTRRVSANRRGGLPPRRRKHRRIIALAPAAVLAASSLLPAATAYWDSNGATGGAGGGGTPGGTWGTDAFWSSSANGDVATAGWNAGDTAVFSAGNDATGTFTVTVNGSQSVSGITFEEGALTLTGGALNVLSGSTTLAVTAPGVATITSQITGSATTSIVKSGTGTLVFSNIANNFSGGMTISAGTLRLGASNPMASQTLTNAGTFDLNGFNQTISSLILGNGVATNEAKVLGPGMLTVNGDITYKGAASNQSAPATIASNLVLPSGTHTLTNATNISNDVYDLVITGVISGAGNLVKGGSDNYLAVLATQNTYTGTTTVNNGILFLGTTNCLVTSSAVTVNTGAALSTAIYPYPGVTPGDYDQQWASLTGAGNVYIGAATLTIGATNTSSTYSGGISDNTLGGKLTKLGSGNLVLSGGNDYRGVTTISAGTLTLGNAGTAGSIAGNVVNNAALAFNRTDTSTYAGNISGSGTVSKSSTGVIVLSSTNTYTGATTITGGVIRAVDGVALPATTSLTLNGGTYEPTTSTFTRALGTGANQVRLTGGASGFSAFGTPLVVDIGGNGSGNGPALSWGSSNFNPSSLILNASSATASIELKNAIDLASSARTIAVNANTATISGVISGSNAASSLIKTGAGTLALRNTNSYAGTTTISGGFLDVTADAQLGLVPAAPLGVSITINAGTLQLEAPINSNRGIALVSASAVISTPSVDVVYAGNVGGTGSLSKTGTAGLSFNSSANTYTGTTSVNAGRLNIVADTSLGAAPTAPTAGKLALNTGGTLAALADLNLHVNRGMSVGTGGATIDTNGFNVTVAGSISGTGNLTKLGAGTLALTNLSSTNSGTTAVNAGILAIAGDGSLGAVPAAPAAAELTLADATTLRALGSSAVHVNRGLTLAGSNATIDTNGSNLTWAGVVSSSGSMTKTGAGTLALANSANTYAGSTTINAGMLGIVADGSLGPVPGAVTPGEILITSATLRADADLSINVNRGVTIGGSAGATFSTQGIAGPPGPFNITYNGAIAGTGDLKVTGAGTLFLRNNGNNYSGATNISNATLNITADSQLGAVPGAATPDKIQLLGTLQAGASFTINANRGMTLFVGGAPPIIDTQALNVSYAGVIAGGGSLTKNGGGTLQLRGADTYTGATRINAGTLNVLADAQLGTPPASPTAANLVLNGAILQAAASFALDPNRGMSLIGASASTIDTQSFNVTCAGAIAGSGPLSKISAGSLTLGTNNGAFSGPLAVSLGTLFAGASSSLGDASPSNTLTITSGGMLVATGPIVGPTRDVVVGGIATINTAGFDSAFGNLSTSSNAAFTKSGAGNLTVKSVRLGGASSMLSVTGGTLSIAPDGTATGVSIVTSTNILAAKLDLSNNHLIDHTSGVGAFSAGHYTGLSAFIQNGRNGGGWNGNGIVTSQSDAAGGNFTTLGVASAAQVKSIASTATSTWAGQTVTGSDALVMYTYGGDANLDGKINVDDYGRIDFNANLGTSGWFNGDFNYDGKINVDDYGIIDFNVGIQGAPFPTGSSLSGVSAVPEPATLSVLSLSAAAALCRRRRRTR